MGPRSYLWNGFADVETKTVTYSMELARIKGFTSVHSHALTQASSVSSNITFGSANDAYYVNSTYLAVNALLNYTYALSSFSYGLIYYSDGVA